MRDYKLKSRAVGLCAVLLLALIAIGGVTAVLTAGNISADQPDNQQLEVDLNYSDGGTTVDVNLSTDGSVVASTTDSASSATTSPQTATVDMTGLAAGYLNLSVEGADESNVTLAETRMVTEQVDALNMTANETYSVDVEFDAVETTNATVEYIDDTGTVLNSTTLTFDPIDYEDGMGVMTAEYTPTTDYNYTDVRVTTENAYGYEAVYVIDDSGTVAGGGFLGASNQQVLGFLALLAGLLLLANRGEML